MSRCRCRRTPVVVVEYPDFRVTEFNAEAVMAGVLAQVTQFDVEVALTGILAQVTQFDVEVIIG